MEFRQANAYRYANERCSPSGASLSYNGFPGHCKRAQNAELAAEEAGRFRLNVGRLLLNVQSG